MTGQEITLRNALGVCSAEEDTQILAQVAAETALVAAEANPADRRVLDLGTGTGYVAIYLAQRGFAVDATDVSERALTLARENVASNDVEVNLYESNLFADVHGPYSLIAFNPPMNPGETELTRLVTSFLRRHQTLANLFMRAFDRFLDSSRLDFLISFLREAQEHLTEGGHVVLELTRLEIDDLIEQMPAFEFGRRVDIPRLPTEQIVVVSARRGIACE